MVKSKITILVLFISLMLALGACEPTYDPTKVKQYDQCLKGPAI